MKKPLLFYTIADDNNLPYAKSLVNSFKKFHKDIPFHIVQGEELKAYLANDPHFFYRATPILTEKYLKEYELVVKMDSDCLVLGDLSYVWNTKDYDVATVMNYNRIDYKMLGGFIALEQIGITPVEYMNNGFVACRSEKFAHQWKVACFTPQFDRIAMREQGILNILCYFGNYNIRCLDHGDGPADMHAWWGLIGKGEWNKAILKDDKIIVPKSDDGFPKVDTEVKVTHMAGGSTGKKDNWGAYFSPEVMKRINYLISEEK